MNESISERISFSLDQGSSVETVVIMDANNTMSSSDAFLETYEWSPDLMMRYSPGISSIFCLAYSIVFVLGIIGNSCVVAVVVRSPRMRTVTNYFIVNLALADILVLIFCLPATLISNLFIREFFAFLSKYFICS